MGSGAGGIRFLSSGKLSGTLGKQLWIFFGFLSIVRGLAGRCARGAVRCVGLLPQLSLSLIHI